MTLKKGWLNEEFVRVDADVRKWPDWMQREAGFQKTDHRAEPTQIEKSVTIPEKPTAKKVTG
jgi:hypothetical protein